MIATSELEDFDSGILAFTSSLQRVPLQIRNPNLEVRNVLRYLLQ